VNRSRKPKVLAISSGGGHWIQLLRLKPAFVDSDLTLVTVKPGYRVDAGGVRFIVVPDSNRWNKGALVRTAYSVLWLLVRERPDVIVTTGAAPGYFAVRFGKWVGARTVWIDSVANAETLSLSGQRAGRHADLWLTQWPHLASEKGPFYRGNVL
jgi:Oligosaccharide biosynthesis protein Alg14 like